MNTLRILASGLGLSVVGLTLAAALAGCSATQETAGTSVLTAVEVSAPCALSLVQAGAAANQSSAGVAANAVNVLNVANAVTTAHSSVACSAADQAILTALSQLPSRGSGARHGADAGSGVEVKLVTPLLCLLVLAGCSPATLAVGGMVAGIIAQDLGAVDAGANLLKTFLPAKPKVCTPAAPNQ